MHTLGKKLKREMPIEEETMVAVKIVSAVEVVKNRRKTRDCSIVTGG